MIFARRALQRRLNELRTTVDGDAVGKLVIRINRPGKDRLAAMWELVILHALAECGVLRNETPLSSGRRPDLSFENGDLQFTADITVVSDDGLDEDNPYFELTRQIEKAKAKLGLPIGGVDLRVKSKHHRSNRGIRTVLRLPPRKQLQAFVRDRVMPLLRDQMDAGKKILQITIDDDEVGLDITIDPERSPFSSGSFTAYNVPKIKDRNPLYNALKAKAAQLRGAQGIVGVIVGDGGCGALAHRQRNWDQVSATTIAEEFLRQYSSIDFVLLLTVQEGQQLRRRGEQTKLCVHPILVVQATNPVRTNLDILFSTMIAKIPKPIMTPINGALRSRESGYDLGHHGGCTMGGRKIRISSRELIEILSGLRTFDDNGAKNVEASRSMPGEPNPVRLAFLQKLKQGELPSAVTVIKTGEDDNDDWIEFEFSDSDPAISRLR